MRLLKLTFQPRLKFYCDYMRFFSLLAWAENPSPLFETGLGFPARAECQPKQKPSLCNCYFYFKRISFRTRDEISTRLTGMKSQPGLKFAM